jgi:3-isopropylmalate/(R)-2-methylmalate dehydratase small subunit
MIVEGRALLIAKDDVDTDVLYPGQFLNVFDPAETVKYLFEGLDPSLRDLLTDDTILFAWENFGTGSSRENVPEAMKAAGIRCVVAKSFARIFHRNCINLGLPAIACPEAASAVRTGSSVRIDSEGGTIEVDGVTYAAPPLPPFMRELLRASGLVPWIQGRNERPSAPGKT